MPRKARAFKEYVDFKSYVDGQGCNASSSYIAYLNREKYGRHLELVNCKIGPGNSGSPIMDAAGNLIGVAKGQVNQRVFLSITLLREELGLLATPACWNETGRPLGGIGMGTIIR